MSVPKESTILITGASGYVGGQIIKEALQKGYNVRIAARTEASALKAIADFPDFKAKLSHVIVPDITKPEGFEHAFDGVAGIIHTASPFTLAPEDNVKDLLEPAINGSTAILKAAKTWGSSVTRVVVTSSFASILDLSQGKREGYVYSEKDWNPTTFEQAAVADGTVAYCASKGLAEKAMWDWIKENNPGFTLTSICPPWVFGPYAHKPKDAKSLTPSVGALLSLNGAKELHPFDFGGYSDVRDVAAAHVLALENPEAAGERFLTGQDFRYQLAADVIRANFPEIKDNVPEGQPGFKEPAYVLDGSKVTKVLGVKYRPFEETIVDTFSQLLSLQQG
jgi:nucleoside-diphosphate-sugar epimerase